jgi:hypothetical protein
MRKTILTVLASALIAATSVQIAAAAERHHPRKVDRTTVSASERFNNANNSIALPAESSGYSAYYTGGGMSAPAGH